MGTEEVVPRKEICGVGAGPGNFCGGNPGEVCVAGAT